jgi:peptide/nickel transport system substrate-binding protein
VLRVALSYDLDNLDPAQLGNRTSHQIANNVYDGLVQYKLGGTELVPALAEKVEVSPDGLTYTFTLRKGVLFHHGFGELTADDVKFSLDRARDPQQSRYAVDLKAVSSITVSGTHQLSVVLSAPDPVFLHKIAVGPGYIVSKAAVEQYGAAFAQKPVGTGPFQFEQWVPDQKAVLVKHTYWGGAPALDRVEFIPITDATAMYQAFEAGNIDLIMVSNPDRYTKYVNDPKIVIAESPGLITRFIAMNAKIEPFNDLRVRQAVQHAINRDDIIEHALKGMSVKAQSPLAPGTFGFEAQPPYEYNPTKAKQLLEAAGLGAGFETTLYLPNIDRFLIPGNVLAENLRAIGVTVKLEVMETASYLAKVRSGEAPMYSHSQNPAVVPDQFLLQRYHPKNFPPGDNDTYYDNPQVTAWIDELTRSTNEAVRKNLIAQIQRQVVADAHYIDLDHEKFIWALHDYVKGYLSDPFRSLRVCTVSIVK